MSRRQFKILEEIAEGGFGKVYLAELISADGQFSRVVAFKLLHEKWSTHDEVLSRTRDEARLLGLLRNDHIVKVEDLTSINGQTAIVMEYLEGVDLKWLIQYLAQSGDPCPLRALCEIVQASADALDSAYNGVPLQGDRPLRVIHRDIKPSNILVTTTGQVKVLDFGTARGHFAKRESHTEELAFGSQGYVSPERALGEPDTPAADVFSLGVTTFELLALENYGKIPLRPAKYETHLEQRMATLSLPGPPELANSLRHFLRAMLAFRPEDRPPASRVVEAMEHLGARARDVALRKFARTVIVAARAAMPAPTPGDSLVGRVLKEDISASRRLDSTATAESVPAPDDEDLPPTVVKEVPASVRAKSPPASASPPTSPRRDDSTSGGYRPRGRRVVLLLSMLGGFVLSVALLLVIAGAAYVIVDELRPRDFVVLEPGEPPESAVRTTLTVDPAEVVEVRLQGERGFLGAWNGPRPVAVRLAPGIYQTFVAPANAPAIRGQRFELTGTECVVTLDLTAQRWNTRCN